MNPLAIIQLIIVAAEAGQRVIALIQALREMGQLTPEGVRQALNTANVPATPEAWKACLHCAEESPEAMITSDE